MLRESWLPPVLARVVTPFSTVFDRFLRFFPRIKRSRSQALEAMGLSRARRSRKRRKTARDSTQTMQAGCRTWWAHGCVSEHFPHYTPSRARHPIWSLARVFDPQNQTAIHGPLTVLAFGNTSPGDKSARRDSRKPR